MKQITYLRVSQPNTGHWQDRHLAAVFNPRGLEGPIVRGIDAWCQYATLTLERYDSQIGEDYFLGPAWAAWGMALRRLLNGDVGRLDAGTLDTIINDNLNDQGFTEDTR